jgi:hypothetical protein
MRGYTPRAGRADDRSIPHPETAEEQHTEDANDHAAVWQRWLFEEALGGIPVPVHLPRRLLRRLWDCTVSDHASESRER